MFLAISLKCVVLGINLLRKKWSLYQPASPLISLENKGNIPAKGVIYWDRRSGDRWLSSELLEKWLLCLPLGVV